jgi:hypothetical protein
VRDAFQIEVDWFGLLLLSNRTPSSLSPTPAIAMYRVICVVSLSFREIGEERGRERPHSLQDKALFLWAEMGDEDTDYDARDAYLASAGSTTSPRTAYIQSHAGVRPAQAEDVKDVERLVSQIRQGATRQHTEQRRLVGALEWISGLPEGRSAILKHRGLAPLCTLLGSEDSDTRVAAEQTLAKCARDHWGRRAIADALVPLLDPASRASRRQIEGAAAACASLADYSGDAREFLTAAGATDALVAHLGGDKASTTAVCERALLAISVLAHYSPVVKGKLVAAGVRRQLSEKLMSSTASPNERALSLNLLADLPGGLTFNLPIQAGIAAVIRCVNPMGILPVELGGRAGAPPEVPSSWRASRGLAHHIARRLYDDDDYAVGLDAGDNGEGAAAAAGERYELIVPEGYAGGDELLVALEDGREVVVGVPDGLAPGDEFEALILMEEGGSD